MSLDTMPLICGIDPGASGGIAMSGLSHYELAHFKMPETETEVGELLREYAPRIQMAFIEAVHAFPGKGEPCPTCHRSNAQGVTSSFNFGRNYGVLRGLLIGLSIPFQEVSPQRWTKALNLVGGKPGTEKKNLHKARAQQMWPGLKKITHATADALLLAEYGRRHTIAPVNLGGRTAL